MAQHNGATIKQNTKTNERGNITASTSAKQSNVDVISEVSAGTHLPGIIIFVHGVNSEGEWYDFAEKALCNGLNDRLFLKESKNKLETNEYKEKRVLNSGESSYLDKSKNSPVIRFYWGYRAGDDDLGKYIVPLKNRQGESYQQHILDKKLSKQEIAEKGPYFWGGGPFQNGCTSLNQLWSNSGFTEKMAAGLVSLQWFNPEDDRLLKDAPARKYYAHAAWRLAMLIQRIRDNSPEDTVTLMSHSQGTMIAAAASLICAPDALFLLNSPYRVNDIMTDALSLHHSDRVTDKAREETLKAVVKAVAQNKNRIKESGREKHISLGKNKSGQAWATNVSHKGNDGTDIPERDNHGRTYIYCNAHDRVMGSAALLSIGWQGLPNGKDGTKHKILADCEGFLFQRMMARSTACGDTPNLKTNFGLLPDMYKEIEISTEDEFGSYVHKMKVPQEPFWDDMRHAVEFGWQAGLASPLLFFKRDFVPIWETPPEWQTLYINGERVPNLLTAKELVDFDKNIRNEIEESGERGAGWGQVSKRTGKANDDSYPYYLPLYQMDALKSSNLYTITILNTLPKDIDSSPAAEEQRKMNRANGKLGKENGWIVWQYGNYGDNYNPSKNKISKDEKIFQFYCYMELNHEKRNNLLKITDEQLKTYISRPTDHSTLPQDERFMSRVAAYDLPIGFGRSLGKIKDELIKLADWTLSDSDFYMEKGILAQESASASLISEFFPGQTILPATIPSGINTETVKEKANSREEDTYYYPF